MNIKIKIALFTLSGICIGAVIAFANPVNQTPNLSKKDSEFLSTESYLEKEKIDTEERQRIYEERQRRYEDKSLDEKTVSMMKRIDAYYDATFAK